MQIKMILRFHLTQSEWPSSNKQTTTNASEAAGGKKELSYTVVRNVN
jgi:hypothetical protein